MIAPYTSWHKFESIDEQLQYLKDHQLLPPTATEPRPLYYQGFFSEELQPCEVVGWLDQIMAVILVHEELHCIHPDHLKDMQPTLQLLTNFVPNYTVIDLETTGFSPYYNEIIELAAIRVRDGRPVESFQSLVRCNCCLPPKITEITGLCAIDLMDAPGIEDILPEYIAFLGDDPLVGHNVSFDARFLSGACARILKRAMTNDLIDTMRISKKLLKLSSYALSDVRIALQLAEHTAHRALGDCETTLDVYEALKTLAPTDATDTFCASPDSKPKKTKKTNYRPEPLERHPELYPAEIVTGEDSPFCGRICVLTGELHISRDEAADMIVQAGGIVKTAVSCKTNYLIVGQQDKSLVGDDGLSSKEEKAIEINESGKGNIQMINETQFCAMLSKEGVPCG